jgi:hypothetical protein
MRRNMHEEHINHVGFEVIVSVFMKGSTLWDITPRSTLKVRRRFGGTYHLFKVEEKAKKESRAKILHVDSVILVSLQSRR